MRKDTDREKFPLSSVKWVVAGTADGRSRDVQTSRRDTSLVRGLAGRRGVSRVVGDRDPSLTV